MNQKRKDTWTIRITELDDHHLIRGYQIVQKYFAGPEGESRLMQLFPAEFYQRKGKIIIPFLRKKFSLSLNDAEDVWQNTCIKMDKAWKRLDIKNFQHSKAIQAYVFKIAENEGNTFCHRMQVKQGLDLAITEEQDDHYEEMKIDRFLLNTAIEQYLHEQERSDNNIDIDAIIRYGRFTAQERQCLILTHVQQLGDEKICEIMGISQKRLSNIRSEIRRKLKEMYDP